jgi:hypothetical protein
MGANAQTSVPLFVANSVLTAAQQNISAATGVPVFATTVTRDAAFGGSNKVLAEGQLCYIEASNIVQYYDGASWATVGPATAGGLVCVKSETAVSAAASATADNVFTSAYTNYRLMINYTTSTTGNIALRLRVGGVSASTNYNIQQLEVGGSTLNNARNTSQTEFRSFIYSNGDFKSAGNADIFQPQLATPTNFIVMDSSSLGGLTTPYLAIRTGNHSTATAYDGIEILAESGTWTGSYTIYGYGKTV